MSNKAIGMIVAAVVIVIGGGYLLMSMPSAKPSSDTTQNSQSTGPKGRVVFSVTDDTANINNVSAINVDVTSVAVHNAANGWVTVSTVPRSYDLLALKANNKSALLADTNIQAGTYDQVRLAIDSVSVKLKDGTVKTAKLPSDQLTIHTNLVVNADKTSNINLDFLADKSLHLTGNGVFIFAPVLHTKIKGDTKIEIDEDSSVHITGGHDDQDETDGMDIDGEFKSNFQIDSKVKLDIDGDDHIRIGGKED